MPAHEPDPGAPARAAPTPLQLLAAVARAARHRADPCAPVPPWAVLAHLDIPRRSGAARRALAVLADLQDAGQVSAQRSRGVVLWSLTASGRRRLARAPDAALELPESPQHRAWRLARASAESELEPLRERLRADLATAHELLAGNAPVPSVRWFALAERLRRDAWAVGAASHSLHEWGEPDDARADLDDGPPGRRNPLLWRAGRERPEGSR